MKTEGFGGYCALWDDYKKVFQAFRGDPLAKCPPSGWGRNHGHRVSVSTDASTCARLRSSRKYYADGKRVVNCT